MMSNYFKTLYNKT